MAEFIQQLFQEKFPSIDKRNYRMKMFGEVILKLQVIAVRDYEFSRR
jgi:hypothetical protein